MFRRQVLDASNSKKPVIIIIIIKDYLINRVNAVLTLRASWSAGPALAAPRSLASFPASH